MNIETRKRIERAIVDKIIRSAIADNYSVSVWNGGDEPEIAMSTEYHRIIDAMFATDEETITLHTPGGKRAGMIYLVYGNSGYDVIADYSVALEEFLQPALELADQYEQES
jgi:hypothetical protein